MVDINVIAQLRFNNNDNNNDNNNNNSSNNEVYVRMHCSYYIADTKSAVTVADFISAIKIQQDTTPVFLPIA